MWDDRNRQKGVSGFNNGETHPIERDTSLLDDQSMIFRIKINFYCMRSVTILVDIAHGSGRIDVSRDEMPINSIPIAYTAFDIEVITDSLLSEVGPQKTLCHRKKCIAFRIPLGDRHTNSVMGNTLTDGQWLLEGILHNESSTIENENTGCGFDNSGEQELIKMRKIF